MIFGFLDLRLKPKGATTKALTNLLFWDVGDMSHENIYLIKKMLMMNVYEDKLRMISTMKMNRSKKSTTKEWSLLLFFLN